MPRALALLELNRTSFIVSAEFTPHPVASLEGKYENNSSYTRGMCTDSGS